MKVVVVHGNNWFLLVHFGFLLFKLIILPQLLDILLVLSQAAFQVLHVLQGYDRVSWEAASVVVGYSFSREPEEKEVLAEIVPDVLDDSPVENVDFFDFSDILRAARALLVQSGQHVHGCCVGEHQLRVKYNQSHQHEADREQHD